MASTTAIDYTARDFDTIKAQLLVHIQNKFPDTWRDFYESGMGQALMEICAYAFDILSFQCDYQANECFLPTAQDRESVLNLGKLVGYRIRTATSASVVCSATITTIQANAVLIPIGTTVTTVDGVTFSTIQEHTISVGSLTTDVTFVQGEVLSHTASASGVGFQKIKLPVVSAIYASITVKVDGDSWEQSDSLVYGEPTSEIFTVEYDDDDFGYVQFGDGINGKLPASGASITISYRTGGGVAGNIAIGKIGQNIVGNLLTSPIVDISVAIYNSLRGSGGEERETLSHAKLWIPRWVKTNGRAVTQEDFDTLANTFSDPVYGAVAFAKAKLRYNIPEYNLVDIYCVTGNTEIMLVDGTVRTIQDLAENQRDPFYVYALDIDRNKIVPALACNPRKTKVVSTITKVTLDNGETVECTPDHRFLLRDGTYREAVDIKIGDSLMSISVNTCEENSYLNGYPQILQPDGSFDIIHQLVVNEILGGYPSYDHVCHHVNFDKNNNDPSNLTVVHKRDHAAMHQALVRALWDDPKFCAMMSEKSSKVMHKLWSDPSFRDKMHKVSSQTAKKTMADSVHKERMRAVSRRNGLKVMKELWKDPEFAKKISEVSSKVMPKTLACLWKDPDFRAFRSEISRECLTRQWADPVFRNKQANLRAERNADPEFQRKSRLGKYRKIAVDALSLGGITRENWETVRGSVSGKPSFDKVIEIFGSVDHMIKELSINHKVVNVKTVDVESTSVYDLSVEKFHNFALASGVFIHNCWGRASDSSIVAASTQLKDAIETYFNNNGANAIRIICTDVEVQDGVIIYIDISASVHVDSDYATTDVLSNVETALGALFEESIIVPGSDFRVGEVYKAFLDVNGVEYGNINEVTASKKYTEIIGVGDGSTTSFSGTLVLEPGLVVVPNSCSILYGSPIAETISDNGSGLLIDSSSEAVGTIDYETGQYTFNFASAPPTGTQVLFYYRYVIDFQRGELELTATGETARMKGSVAYPPIVPFTSGQKGIAFSDGNQVVIDDGSGLIIGDIDPSGINTVDYSTGAYDFTFINTPANSAEIRSTYRQLLRSSSQDLPINSEELAVESLISISTM